jgi:prepilin-type N-terminal cleavage/methylation domain-containing protein
MIFAPIKKKNAFTLVELVIVIVIVGILSLVAVPIYRGYTRKAMTTEGKALIKNIENSEKVYYVEFCNYYTASETSFNPTLDVDARANKYFTTFKVDVNGDGFVAQTSGSGTATGVSLTLTKPSLEEQSTIIENGLSD